MRFEMKQKSNGIVGYVAAAFLVLQSAPCLACPSCELGVAVRRSFWHDSFAARLLSMLAPLVVVVFAALVVYPVGRAPRHKGCR